MRALLLASVVLVALAALGVASTAAATRVARGGGEFASGEAFAFFAQKRDQTTSGWAWFFMANTSPYPVEGRVRCLLVKGDKAAMTGTLTVPVTMPGSDAIMRTFSLVVEDLGSGGTAPTDAAGLSFGDGATASPCSSAIGNSGFAMEAGDVTVR
ncbi:MAG: hypothetical protein M3Q10_19440 [Chloroflexota bacterium]|nr:hypothetical protein [Chloroflexota bacterium]